MDFFYCKSHTKKYLRGLFDIRQRMVKLWGTVCVLALAVAVASGASTPPSAWAGAWTDEFGGNFYVCVDGNRVNGFYSMYGIARGTASSNGEYTGYWYEPSITYPNNNPSYGFFVLTMSEDRNSFSGKDCVHVCLSVIISIY